MKYMMLIYLDENSLSDEERERCYQESAQYAQELGSGGKCLAAMPLHPTATATSVRIRNDKPIVTDGPFAETREQLGGFFLVEAKDLDEAIEIASKIPAGRWGEASDLAGATVFLASPASDYVSGTVLTVDGGWMGR